MIHAAAENHQQTSGPKTVRWAGVFFRFFPEIPAFPFAIPAVRHYSLICGFFAQTFFYNSVACGFSAHYAGCDPRARVGRQGHRPTTARDSIRPALRLLLSTHPHSNSIDRATRPGFATRVQE
ncbi:MAG: hypothetical protein CMJ65_10470 [Planctomycetaceae bacterium]|nr:hypothetical protein [Planctomycetaceae bacterium]